MSLCYRQPSGSPCKSQWHHSDGRSQQVSREQGGDGAPRLEAQRISPRGHVFSTGTDGLSH